MNNKNNIRKKIYRKKNIIIDYKDINLLNKYVSECYKILPSKTTGTKLKYQHKISKSIKIARFLSLIPYTDKQTIKIKK
ncbi:30S ribosomal protein S18 [endosymbiont of Euscepes postfasciatus]|uniref:30S ribosomal protein S18 n=1 Tax=endosymbiont of Euscepes postfasciatus TaxID=650377 RepID=UPI000DC72178|nr:30S ribosomal protein S18 [endosymbiont of Euscepes postfasciatus]BBA84592.1 30S ribosomal protein S18 [endosymbiont of Euscepes postfasciatus]